MKFMHFCSLFLAGLSLTLSNLNTIDSQSDTMERAKLFETYLTEIPSAWKGHRDFAEWLVDEVKPEQVVDLGIDYGFSTFVLTNAAEKNGKGIVTGIDSFQGEGMTGIRNTYDYVLNVVNTLNFKNVEIIRGDFNEVNKDWTRVIDILHIDGYHSYEAVSNDFNTWSPYVNGTGIILFHDINVPNPDFGVVYFFRELQDGYKLYFLHSYGLGIYTKNKELYEAIKARFSNVYDDETTPL